MLDAKMNNALRHEPGLPGVQSHGGSGAIQMIMLQGGKYNDICGMEEE